MIHRLLGRLGMSGYVPASSDLGFDHNNTDAPDAPLGEARVTFLGGSQTPYSQEESALAQQDRGEEVGADIVWPGKPTTIGFSNEEPLAYRYNLTITNLPNSHYVILPPVGGQRHPEGGVLLQPGEEVAFEVRFPPLAREQARSQAFHFVLTRFDPRRSSDPGVVIGEDAARWVPLPENQDFALSTDVQELRIRPWRRDTTFRLKLSARSFLPATAQMHILRAPTRQTLQDNAEQVEMIQQPLEARQSGEWRCELPPSRLRNSYWTTVRGAMRVGEHQSIPIGLSKPVYVRYIPWLRMGRDWLLLIGALFSLMWMFWGVPVLRAPIVSMRVSFDGLRAGDLPQDGKWSDLKFQINAINDKPLVKPIPGVCNDGVVIFEDFPRDLYGYRWPCAGDHWPFNRWSMKKNAPRNFKVAVTLTDSGSDKSDVYAKYDLKTLRAQDNNSTQDSDTSHFVIPIKGRPFLGEWPVSAAAIVPVANAVYLNVSLSFANNPGLRQAAQQGQQVILVWEVDGTPHEEPRTLPANEKQAELNEVYIDVHKSTTLKVYAVVDKIPSEAQTLKVKPQKSRFKVQLAFPHPLEARPQPVTRTSPPAQSPITWDPPKIPGSVVSAPPFHTPKSTPKIGQSHSSTSGTAKATPKPQVVPVLPSPANPPVSERLGNSQDPAPNPDDSPAQLEPVTEAPNMQPPDKRNVIVLSTAKTSVLPGNNIVKPKEALLNGNIKLSILEWKPDGVKVNIPGNAREGLMTVELFGDKRTRLAEYTLYRVPRNLLSTSEQPSDAARDGKQVASLISQGEKAFREFQEDQKAKFWAKAANDLKEAQTYYASILKVEHTADDAAEAHYKLALIASNMSDVLFNWPLGGDSSMYLEHARQEAGRAAQENSRAHPSPTHLTDEIFQLLKKLE